MTTCPKFSGTNLKIWRKYLKNEFFENLENTFWNSLKKHLHRYKYSKQKCIIIMILFCNKQHFSNILSSTHKKVKQHWGWVEKSVVYK